jgi:hypothetical protein
MDKPMPTLSTFYRVLAVHVGSHLCWALLFGVGALTGGSTVAVVAFYDAFVLGFLGPVWPLAGGFLVFLLTGTLCGVAIACADPKPRQVLPAALASLLPTYMALFAVSFLRLLR